LQIVADALGVNVKFFYDGKVNAKDVESLLFLDIAFSLRILRAYTSFKYQAVQRQFVTLVELVADSQSLGASKKPPPRKSATALYVGMIRSPRPIWRSVLNKTLRNGLSSEGNRCRRM